MTCARSVLSRLRSPIGLLLAVSLVLTAAGCYPTYPKEKFEESIVELCKREYDLDVKVGSIGKTVAIYLPLPDLIDFTFAITKGASEKINDVILSATRVALSTDADYDFYVVIAHDVRIPEIQIVIIKSVNDAKRFLLNDISRGDYSKRMLIDMRLNPQAQKERSVRDVFQKMGLDQDWQEEVMDDFFRSEPTALSDIGYWNERFFIKDVTLPEFLAEQIASRIKIEFRDNKKLDSALQLKSVTAQHAGEGEEAHFAIEVLAQPKVLAGRSGEAVAPEILGACARVAATVLHIYRYKDFTYVKILDGGSGRTVTLSRDDLETIYRDKRKLAQFI